MFTSLRSASRCLGRLPVAAARTMTSTPPSQSFKLPDLPFDYGELEPYISAGIMDVHHKKVNAWRYNRVSVM